MYHSYHHSYSASSYPHAMYYPHHAPPTPHHPHHPMESYPHHYYYSNYGDMEPLPGLTAAGAAAAAAAAATTDLCDLSDQKTGLLTHLASSTTSGPNCTSSSSSSSASMTTHTTTTTTSPPMDGHTSPSGVIVHTPIKSCIPTPSPPPNMLMENQHPLHLHHQHHQVNGNLESTATFFGSPAAGTPVRMDTHSPNSSSVSPNSGVSHCLLSTTTNTNGSNASSSQPPPGKTRTRDKYRVVYSDVQRLELEKEFNYSKYITIRRKSELANLLQLSERQVKIWFQNRRAKDRKLMKKKEESCGKRVDIHQQQQQMMHSKSEPVMMINTGVDDVVGPSDQTMTHNHHNHHNHNSDCPLTPSLDSNVTGSSGSSSISSGSDSGIGISTPYSYHHHHHPSVMYMSPVAVAAAAAAHNNYLSSYHYDN